MNSFSQGGVGSNDNNYMTPRGEYISRPPCNRVTLQTGTSYPTTDQVAKESARFLIQADSFVIVGVVGVAE